MFESKTDLASLKTNADNFDVDKLKNVPANLSKPSNVVNNDFVKKRKIYMFEKLVNKVNTLILRCQVLVV